MHVEIRDPDDKIILSKVKRTFKNPRFMILIWIFSGLQQWRQIHFYFPHPWRACHLLVQVPFITCNVFAEIKCKAFLTLSFPAILPSGSLALSWGFTLTSRYVCQLIYQFSIINVPCHADMSWSSSNIITKVGEHAIDYANVAQKEKLSELQLRVRQLLDQVSFNNCLASRDFSPSMLTLFYRWNRSPRSRTIRGEILIKSNGHKFQLNYSSLTKHSDDNDSVSFLI